VLKKGESVMRSPLSRTLLLTALGIALPIPQAHAQQGPDTGGWSVVNPPTPTRRYGMAGCGLGSILLPNGPHFITSFINGFAWNQVFMISSGTSNCQSENSRQVMLEQEHFIANNYRDVARDAAQGQGDTLAGLAKTLGCEDSQQQRFASLAQQNYSSIFSQPGALAALHSLKEKISADQQLQSSCKYAALPAGHAGAQ
jgi:hypothetical protein